MYTKPVLDWLGDPEVFAVNRLPAHSDHSFYERLEDAAGSEMPLKQSLNGTWRFHYAERPAARPQDFFQPDFDSRVFGTIEVPGHMQLQGYGRPQYVNTMYPWDGKEYLRPPQVPADNSVGSHLRRFILNENLQGKRVVLQFAGVETALYVWLNGAFVGYSEDSFTPSEFDITAFLREGENLLAVEVYRYSSASWLEDQDFWRFSGIFREVALYGIPTSHVRDVFAKPCLDDGFRLGTMAVDMELDGEPCAALVRLLTPEGIEVTADIVSGTGRQSLCLRAGEVRCWSAEAPYLYTLQIELRDKTGGLVEVSTLEVGFRHFAMRDGLMLLNGQRIVFRGINRHEFSHRRGRAITEEDMLWDIRFLKQNNINAVRTSHYPNQSLWYRLCDRYGIYLIDEANLESHGSWQKMGKVEPSWNVPGDLPEWRGAVLDRAAAMLERDKNHPCVLIWSCGNESYAGENIAAMANFFRQRDSGRLVHYEGVFHNRRFEEISDMESRMYVKPADIEAYVSASPSKPYISCEYSHGMGNSCGGLHLYTSLEDKFAQYQGGFLWDYIDQALEVDGGMLCYGGDFTDRPTDYGFCTNGIVYADRRVSPKAQEVKALYADLRLTVLQNAVVVENRRLFMGTQDCLFVCTLNREGETLWTQAFSCEVAPGGKGSMLIPWPVCQAAGEYVMEVSARLREGCMWAAAGHEIAFGQRVVAAGTVERMKIKALPQWRVVPGDVNIGVVAEGFQVLFARDKRGLVSLVYDGREFICQAPHLAFWRAPTDNDGGYGLTYECAVWKTADLYAKQTECVWQEHPDGVDVTYRYGLPGISATAQVCYRVRRDGSITVDASYSGGENLPGLPLFGMHFCLPTVYGQFRYYGIGPEENYADRNQGGRLGVFSGNAKENLSGYLKPQECGGRTDVRWLRVEDEQGNGLTFTANPVPFAMSVLHYSPHELENAQHMGELPPVYCTRIQVLAAQMGVGGDDSWGAPVHAQYRLSSAKPLEVSFTITGNKL